MKTIIDLFEESVSKFSENPYIWEKQNDKFLPTTYAQTREEVYQMAAGLMSLGVAKDDNVHYFPKGGNFGLLELAFYIQVLLTFPSP